MQRRHVIAAAVASGLGSPFVQAQGSDKPIRLIGKKKQGPLLPSSQAISPPKPQ